MTSGGIHFRVVDAFLCCRQQNFSAAYM